VSPARACAYEVLLRVDGGAWADRALQGETGRRELSPRDRALATQLAYGTVQRQATLDHVIEQLSGRPAARLDAAVRVALRLGLYQLLFLERVPAHAAVTESVDLVKARAPRAAGLVNAVLRRATREAWRLVAALDDATPERAALKHSHPDWIARLWWDVLGPDDAKALMATDNRAPEPVLRANTLKTTPEALAAALPVGSHPADGLPEALDPQPGERVLDLCAAPGGKTTHLAALMGGEGAVTAVERDARRAARLTETARRMGAAIVEVRRGDAAEFDEQEAYDRVLVDPPCSDLGTLALRPDARWHKQPEDPERLATVQRGILRAGARALKPGGTLVYSTCTISPQENERLVEGFLAEHADFALEDPHSVASDLPVWEHPRVPGVLQTLPHRDGTDGFFVARLRKAA
jgi:16S rRNA (cytosine967-C5)-methyltransferase